MSENLIRLQGIDKTYYGTTTPVHALRSVFLDLIQGEMVAIMGASGSGKSTLMNILGCLDKPDSGRYSFAGQDVMGLDRDQLAHMRSMFIGFVFQSFNLIGRATALDNVCLPLIYAGVKSQREREKRGCRMLKMMGLEGREHHLPRQLSGGQQQRVAIARALVNDPGLLLADEPTGALDTRTSEEIMRLLTKLNHEQGLTVVIITHEAAIGQFCQRIIRLSDGRIVDDQQQGNVTSSLAVDIDPERRESGWI
ncbi:MAG: ABC transporter ATP-binding protein [Syntrophomonas sp.]|nr:ABC transporter ATP-binding protein [Syntrophomonas sp.]